MKIEDSNREKTAQRLLIVANVESLVELKEHVEWMLVLDKNAPLRQREDIHNHWEEEPAIWQKVHTQIRGLRQRVETPPFILIGLIDNL